MRLYFLRRRHCEGEAQSNPGFLLMKLLLFLAIVLLMMFQFSDAFGEVTPPIPTSQSPLLPVESMAVMGDVGHTQLVIQLPQQAYYQISTDDTHQNLVLSLYNIDPKSLIPPLDLDNTAIQNIQYNMTDDDQLVLTLNLAPTVDVQGLRMEGGQLILDVGIGAIPYVKSEVQNVKTSGPYQPLVKTPEPLSPDEVAQEDYQEALVLLNQSNTVSAVLLLQTILQQHPDFEQARVTLAETYLSQNKPQLALQILKTVDFPDVSSHLSYYTALAESYRQTGDAKTAADLYQSLLKLNPNNATWWAGLGMCFEMLKQNQAAHEAYIKANSFGNLSVSLQLYISKKLATS